MLSYYFSLSGISKDSNKINLKGVYVIFDVRPLFVYSFAFLTFIIIVLAVGIYYQYSVSAFDYIELAIQQYKTL